MDEDVGPEVFLLRVWAEPRDLPDQLAVYRARVEHAGRRRVRYLSGLRGLVDFVRACLADSGLPPGRFEEDLDDPLDRDGDA